MLTATRLDQALQVTDDAFRFRCEVHKAPSLEGHLWRADHGARGPSRLMALGNDLGPSLEHGRAPLAPVEVMSVVRLPGLERGLRVAIQERPADLHPSGPA
jgi:hypothetical protein